MNTHSIPRAPQTLLRHVALITTASLCALLLLSGEAQARTGTATGSNGNSAARSVTRSGGDVSSSTTGSNGNTVSRDVDRSTTGTTATTTGVEGETLIRTTAPTASGLQTNVTGPRGGTGALTVTH